MNTLSINKEEKKAMTQIAYKWWNSKNVLISTFTGEDFTNKEVVLTHLVLISLLIGGGCAEAYPAVTGFMMGTSAWLVKLLNKADSGNHKH